MMKNIGLGVMAVAIIALIWALLVERGRPDFREKYVKLHGICWRAASNAAAVSDELVSPTSSQSDKEQLLSGLGRGDYTETGLLSACSGEFLKQETEFRVRFSKCREHADFQCASELAAEAARMLREDADYNLRLSHEGRP